MDKVFSLSVYNTITKKYEYVEVSEEIFNTYRRLNWNQKSNQKRHKAEMPFCSLKCPEGSSIENFHEFSSNIDNPEKIIEEKSELELVSKSLKILTEKERKAFVLSVFYDISQSKIARLLNVNQSTVNRNLNRAIEKLKK